MFHYPSQIDQWARVCIKCGNSIYYNVSCEVLVKVLYFETILSEFSFAFDACWKWSHITDFLSGACWWISVGVVILGPRFYRTQSRIADRGRIDSWNSEFTL